MKKKRKVRNKFPPRTKKSEETINAYVVQEKNINTAVVLYRFFFCLLKSI